MKKYSFKKLIGLFLGGIMLFSSLTACKDREGENLDGTGGSSSNITESEKYPLVGEKTDIGKIVKTSKIIANNGDTDYKILLPKNPSSDLQTAASELSLFMAESAGVSIRITSEYVAGNKYFSLGKTEITESNNLEGKYEELGSAGYKIKTVGDDICIYGYSDLSIVYGVYEYLERMCGFDYFWVDTYTIDKVSTLYLYDFDCVDIPDFEFRISNGGSILDKDVSNTTKRRLRMTDYHESFVNPRDRAGCWHNVMGMLRPKDYYEGHKEWYNDHFAWDPETGEANLLTSQLCYTAHGNEIQLAQMVETTADLMFTLMLQYPDQNEITLNMEDNPYECECSACSAHYEKYGARTASVILFFNRVAPLLGEKLASVDDPRKDTYKIGFYAYYEYQEAPVEATTDASGNITFSYAPEMKLNEHVIPMYANIFIDLTQSVDSEINAWHYLTVKKWNEIASGMHVWLYDIHFKKQGYMLYYDSAEMLAEHFREFKSIGADWMFLEADGDCTTAFWTFKNYLISKLEWNIDADIAELTDRFFEGVYGTQSEEMKTIYLEVKALMTRNGKELGLSTDVQAMDLTSNPAWWPKTLLASWYERMVVIEQKLLEDGNELAAKWVRLEQISPLYMLIDRHRLTFSENQAGAYKEKMRELFNEFSIVKVSQTLTVADSFTTWG